MSRIAVVGSGIAGLATSWILSRRHDVLLFEKAARLGGHTHTHHVETADGPLALDTRFLVHNDRTYPLLVRLFGELDVERIASDMSFAVSCRDTGFEYSTRDLSGLFADRWNTVRPGYHAFLHGVLRFQRRARRLVGQPDLDRMTLGEFLESNRIAGDVVERFVLPLASAIWSMSTGAIRDFPAGTLVRFMHQHGMLTAFDHPAWQTIKGGCASYIPPLVASDRITVHLESAPRSVRRTTDGVELEFSHRPTVRADEIVFACHGDEVLPMLGDPTPAEREVLGAFRTARNYVWLHTDASWLPVRPAARAAWNYQIGEDAEGATVTYHLNRLQRLNARQDYCVTLNPNRPVAAEHVIAHETYTHPLYTREAVAAQQRWREISGVT